ncbi:MAG: hypothetical protein K2R98_31685 [Gemmataceae bacterium]|nr:hypothetical protein [Gemmataceae bacterium]
MIPLVPFLLAAGQIAAGAQIARGIVRGAGELARGRTAAAVVEVADGCVAPLRLAGEQLGSLGRDILAAVLGNGEPLDRTPIVVPPRQKPRVAEPAGN